MEYQKITNKITHQFITQLSACLDEIYTRGTETRKMAYCLQMIDSFKADLAKTIQDEEKQNEIKE